MKLLPDRGGTDACYLILLTLFQFHRDGAHISQRHAQSLLYNLSLCHTILVSLIQAQSLSVQSFSLNLSPTLRFALQLVVIMSSSQVSPDS